MNDSRKDSVVHVCAIWQIVQCLVYTRSDIHLTGDLLDQSEGAAQTQNIYDYVTC